MSLGTRSPVDLLRDIMEVLGAKARYLHPDQCVFCYKSEDPKSPCSTGLDEPLCPSVSLFVLSVTTWDNNEISGMGKTARQGDEMERQKSMVKIEARGRTE